MISVLIPTHLINELDEETINDICVRSLGRNDFEIKEENRGRNTGQYIKLLYENKVKYICLSRGDSRESRNAFVLQNFPTAYSKYLSESNEYKEFEYYIRDIINSQGPYIMFSYKVLLTAGIKVLNIEGVIPSDRVDYLDHRTPFINYKQMRKVRLDLRNRNVTNRPTTFEAENDEIIVYGKTYGANGRETAVICLALSKLQELPIRLFNVNESCETHTASVDPSNKGIFDSIGVIIDEEIVDFSVADEETDVKRNTRKFHINLLEKYKDKKCYICGCDIENLIIGSHIHRVTDIINSTESTDVKKGQIIDGDNGLWLCANHDKLFEFGHIYFDQKELLYSDKLSPEQKIFVDKITFDIKNSNAQESNYDFAVAEETEPYGKKFFIGTEDYNEKMESYLEKHRNRVLD